MTTKFISPFVREPEKVNIRTKKKQRDIKVKKATKRRFPKLKEKYAKKLWGFIFTVVAAVLLGLGVNHAIKYPDEMTFNFDKLEDLEKLETTFILNKDVDPLFSFLDENFRNVNYNKALETALREELSKTDESKRDSVLTRIRNNSPYNDNHQEMMLIIAEDLLKAGSYDSAKVLVEAYVASYGQDRIRLHEVRYNDLLADLTTIEKIMTTASKETENSANVDRFVLVAERILEEEKDNFKEKVSIGYTEDIIAKKAEALNKAQVKLAKK